MNLVRLAADLRQAHLAMDAAFDRRDEPGGEGPWSEAARRFRALEAEFESVVRRLLDGLAAGAPIGVEDAIWFLEVDPWCFRSGYAKARLMRRLVTAPLNSAQCERLTRVILTAVDTGLRWEMRDTLRLARGLGGRTLRRELRTRMHGKDMARAWRAMIVLTRLRRPKLSEADRVKVRKLVLWDLRNLQERGEELWTGWSLRAGRTAVDDDWARELERLTGTKGLDAESARALLEMRRL